MTHLPHAASPDLASFRLSASYKSCISRIRDAVLRDMPNPQRSDGNRAATKEVEAHAVRGAIRGPDGIGAPVMLPVVLPDRVGAALSRAAFATSNTKPVDG